MNYEEIVNYLYNLPRFRTGSGMERERELLKLLGNPERKLKIVHIAGTNGKGSVCAYMERILRMAGFVTGAFTSPHLVRVNERIRICGEDVSDEEFMDAFFKVRKASEEMEAGGHDGAAFFDYLTAMAMLIFVNRKVDYVLMETGLGGRLDCTNAVENPILCVITSISLDHTEILGDSLIKIAGEKAGIIKRQVPVVFWSQPQTRSVFVDAAEKSGCKFIEVCENHIAIEKIGKKIDFLLNNQYYKNDMFSIGTIAPYQAANSSIALTAIAVLEEQRYLQIPFGIKKKAILQTVWAGRMEEVRENFYLDGAHNSDGIRVFLETVKNQKARKKILLFSAVCEKDYEDMIRRICDSGIFDLFVVTELDNHRALSRDTIEEVFKKWTKMPVYKTDCVKDAIQTALLNQKDKDVVFAAGSLYLVGEIKAAFLGGNDD